MKKPRWFLTNAQKVVTHLYGRVKHIYQNLFLVSDADENFITDDGNNTFITDESDY